MLCSCVTQPQKMVDFWSLWFSSFVGLQGAANLWKKMKNIYYYTSEIFVVKANISNEGCSIGSLCHWHMVKD